MAPVTPLSGSMQKQKSKMPLPNLRVYVASRFSCLFPSGGCNFRRSPRFPPSAVVTNCDVSADPLIQLQEPHPDCELCVPCRRRLVSPPTNNWRPACSLFRDNSPALIVDLASRSYSLFSIVDELGELEREVCGDSIEKLQCGITTHLCLPNVAYVISKLVCESLLR